MTSAGVMDGRSALAGGDGHSDRCWFEAAYSDGERTGDEIVMAEAVLGLYGPWVHAYRTATARGMMDARLQHVLSLVDAKSTLGLRLRARAAAESDYRLGEHAEILAVVDEARSGDDPLVRMEALSLAHHCLLGPDHTRQRRALADELIAEAARAGHRANLAIGLVWLVTDLFLAADPHAQRRLGELRALLAEHELPAVEFVARAMEVMLAIRDGRLDEAEPLARECRERGIAAGDVDADGWFGAQLVAIRWYQGRLPELLPLLTEMVNSPELSTVDNSFLAAYAVAAAQSGDGRAAAGALAALRGRSLADLPRSSSWLVTMYGIVEAARLLGNVQASARAYELLLPFADLPMAASMAVACFGSVHHALGVAAMTMGDLDRAAGHLREAVHRNLALRHWPAVVESRLRYVEALARRGGSGDLAVSAEQRAEAAALAFAASAAAPSARELAERPSAQIQEPASPATQPGAVELTRHGVRWRVDLGPRSVLVDHSVGMLHLAVLTANPGVEVAAIDLAAGVAALGKAAAGLRADPAAADRAAPSQPVLDRAAIQQYRQRLSQLDKEIDAFESGDTEGTAGEAEAVARARSERDWLLAELSANAGLGGRSRAFADGRERARLAVGRAIRRAFGHIDRADPVIGAHLRAAVHTGAHCWYRPI
jgi:hypothetical protein